MCLPFYSILIIIKLSPFFPCTELHHKHFTMAKSICLQWAPISRPSLNYLWKPSCCITRSRTFLHSDIWTCPLLQLWFGHLLPPRSPIPSQNISAWEARRCILWYLQASNNTLWVPSSHCYPLLQYLSGTFQPVTKVISPKATGESPLISQGNHHFSSTGACPSTIAAKSWTQFSCHAQAWSWEQNKSLWHAVTFSSWPQTLNLGSQSLIFK